MVARQRSFKGRNTSLRQARAAVDRASPALLHCSEGQLPISCNRAALHGGSTSGLQWCSFETTLSFGSSSVRKFTGVHVPVLVVLSPAAVARKMAARWCKSEAGKQANGTPTGNGYGVIAIFFPVKRLLIGSKEVATSRDCGLFLLGEIRNQVARW